MNSKPQHTHDIAETAAAVTQAEDGSWQVVGQTGEVLASGMTNADAWDWIDRATNQQRSRRQAVNDWVTKPNGNL